MSNRAGAHVRRPHRCSRAQCQQQRTHPGSCPLPSRWTIDSTRICCSTLASRRCDAHMPLALFLISLEVHGEASPCLSPCSSVDIVARCLLNCGLKRSGRCLLGRACWCHQSRGPSWASWCRCALTHLVCQSAAFTEDVQTDCTVTQALTTATLQHVISECRRLVCEEQSKLACSQATLRQPLQWYAACRAAPLRTMLL
jgi:hypothetical protein